MSAVLLPRRSVFLGQLFALFGLVSGALAAKSVTLAWDKNPEPDIAHYRLYYGTKPGLYPAYVDTATTSASVSNLFEGATYFFAVTAWNAGGESGYSNEVSYTVPGEADGFLANVSSRALVQTDDFALIGGFIILSEEPKKVAVRAIGASLSSEGVSGSLQDPTLELIDSSGSVVASSDDWQPGGDDLAGLGLAPGDARESAFSTTLSTGAYSAVVRGKDSGMGVALFELHDLDANAGRIANISTRSRVERDDDVLIGGFILAGTQPSRVLARAIGPSLTLAGIRAASRPEPRTARRQRLTHFSQRQLAGGAGGRDYRFNALTPRGSGSGDPLDSRAGFLLGRDPRCRRHRRRCALRTLLARLETWRAELRDAGPDPAGATGRVSGESIAQLLR